MLEFMSVESSFAFLLTSFFIFASSFCIVSWEKTDSKKVLLRVDRVFDSCSFVISNEYDEKSERHSAFENVI